MHTTWNNSALFKKYESNIYPDTSDWEQATNEFASKWKPRSDYLQSPVALLEALTEYNLWVTNFGSEPEYLYYFWLKNKIDQNNSEVKANLSKLTDLSTKLCNQLTFFELNLGKITPELQIEFLNDPSLKDYTHFLQKIFADAKYMLSEPEEKILSLTSKTSYSNWRDMLDELLSAETATLYDENGASREVTLAELMSLISNTNKKVRDEAAAQLNLILQKYSKVAEHEINSILESKRTRDELRGFDYPEQARHLSDDIDSQVVNAMVQAVSSRFDLAKKFYQVKAKMLGQEKLEYHERNVPVSKLEINYSAEESIKLVADVLNNIDTQFADIFNNFVNNSLLDFFPAQGKSDGAFCAHALVNLPTFILLNHTGKLRDVTTLAHEVGHGINNELIKKAQIAISFDTPLSTAEVASTFFEDFVLDHVSKDMSSEQRQMLIMEKLNDEVSTIFRQVACYLFEQELHKEFRAKGYLSNTQIGELFSKHMASYMGDYVLQTAGNENWWIYWGHIRSYFYNYSYASGLLISKALQAKYKQDPNFITQVKQFLSVGMSQSPKQAFANMGIDITSKEFWQQGLSEFETMLEKVSATDSLL